MGGYDTKEIEEMYLNHDDFDLSKMVGYKKNTGELIELMKIAMKSKKFDKVDDYIKTQVVKFLYNDGRGANVKNFNFQFISSLIFLNFISF